MVRVDELQAFLLDCQLRLPEQERLNSGISDRRPSCEIFDNKGRFDVIGRGNESSRQFVQPGKSRAQRAVPAHDFGKASLEREYIERPSQPISEAKVELG